MTVGRVGDHVIEESEHVGHAGREGQVIEVLGADDGVHYRIRWEDGRETVLFPSSGSLRFVPRRAAAKR